MLGQRPCLASNLYGFCSDVRIGRPDIQVVMICATDRGKKKKAARVLIRIRTEQHEEQILAERLGKLERCSFCNYETTRKCA